MALSDTTIVVGEILGQKLTEESVSLKSTLGHRVRTRDGAEYEYMQDSGAGVTGQGYSVLIDAAGQAVMITTTLAAQGHRVAQAARAVTASYYFWGCVYDPNGVDGPGVVVATLAAADVILYTTATPGVLDDAVTTAVPRVKLNVNNPAGADALIALVEVVYPMTLV